MKNRSMAAELFHAGRQTVGRKGDEEDNSCFFAILRMRLKKGIWLCTNDQI
jgi:hypothetical protein